MVRADPDEYGGFLDEASAQSRENQFFWRLGQVTLDIAPQFRSMKSRSAHVPSIFLNAIRVANINADDRDAPAAESPQASIIYLKYNNTTHQLTFI